ncbi:MAG: efflux RND transporter permease subunit [Rhodospirillaceae bacterium]|nr:efflux RND transporter permease subunit [Rhodospirillaceae bacterium]MBT5192020.1 efflux RND transporter permease subunit [Rhodospirillaceae bacterium]MBT5896373.1 efflux RND transporter permease subunit [Rhodospirillaceae bacterium]MBT6426039.1 efflux RND transporter permease subunit [Rhodospirillaceae bacterium]MBT7760238.1 efflux RND transporter permease subunit [Rhodospirillaceae bacterium]
MVLGLGDLPSLAVRRPTLIVVINLLIIVAGLSALLGVEVRELPDVDRPWVSVRAFFEGASPETMDAEVTSVIEGAVARVAGVRTISSASEEDNARVWAQFAPSVDIDVAANDVREAVAGVERRLPEGVEDIVVVKADTNARPIIRLALTSDRLSQEALTHLAEEDVKPELTAIPGVALVNLFGARKKMLRVVVDPMRLASYHLSIDDVARVLASTDMDVPAGSFKSDDQLLLVRADASLWRPEDVERLAINDNVRLGDVARAIYGPKEALSHTLLNGRKVIGLTLVRKAKSNTIAISDAVDKTILRLNRHLKDAQVIKISDDARFIRGSIREVVYSLGIATLVVIAVIYVFMTAVRPTLIPAIAIPIALSGTIAAIWLLGFSINILTLLALVLATGMIVDDAIVVVENIQRQRAQGKPPLAAAVLGTRQVFFAVLATTATLVSVFLPIAFLPSVAGKLFSEFGFVLAIAVAISSFVALTLCPMLAARLPADWGAPNPGGPGFLARIGNVIVKAYQRLLDFTLDAPVLFLGGAVLIALCAVAVYPTVDQELLPKEDRGAIIIYMQGPDGVGLDYMDRQSAQAEAILQPLLESGEISNIFAIVGRWDLNRVYLLAPLTPWSERERSQLEIAKSLRGPLKAIPGATARVSTPNSLNLRRSGGRLEFTLTGGNYAEIAAAADDFLAAMHKRLPNLDDPEIEYQQTQPQLSLKVNRQRAEDLGVPVEGITTTLRAMVDGLEVAELNVNDRTIPVRIESAAGAINDPSDLSNLFVPSASGQLVPLSAFITLEEVGVAAELDRAGQKRAIEIDAPLAPDYTLQQAMADVEALASDILPPGIGLHFIREAATLQDTSHDVAITFAVAILVVLLVLAAQFESVFSAVVIVLTVPFGLAAAVFALKFTDSSLNIYSQIGLVMLVGLMAKNGILVVEFADQLRDQGHSIREAVREAALTRLRPVMMTMLSTVLGALPLILGSGPGMEARAAIGWVVFGGLGMATVFTLILIPVLYSLLARFRAPRAHAGQRLRAELSEIEQAAE